MNPDILTVIFPNLATSFLASIIESSGVSIIPVSIYSNLNSSSSPLEGTIFVTVLAMKSTKPIKKTALAMLNTVWKIESAAGIAAAVTNGD